MIHINNIENRITFKIYTGSYLELLMHEIKTLLGSTKSKITKDENGRNVPHFEITEEILVHDCQQGLSARFKSLVYICS